jgi:hypothetical protein
MPRPVFRSFNVAEKLFVVMCFAAMKVVEELKMV